MGLGFGHELPQQGLTNIWLTPKKIIEVLGPFDLDPCAAPEPRPWDTATTHHVEKDDGLSQVWNGFVWCNPPYGDQTGVWLQKLAAHGNGIALVFARTETKWFQAVAKYTSLMFFPAGRLKFCLPDGSEKSYAGAPSVFMAFGETAKARLLESGLSGVYTQAVK